MAPRSSLREPRTQKNWGLALQSSMLYAIMAVSALNH